MNPFRSSRICSFDAFRVMGDQFFFIHLIIFFFSSISFPDRMYSRIFLALFPLIFVTVPDSLILALRASFAVGSVPAYVLNETFPILACQFTQLSGLYSGYNSAEVIRAGAVLQSILHPLHLSFVLFAAFICAGFTTIA